MFDQVTKGQGRDRTGTAAAIAGFPQTDRRATMTSSTLFSSRNSTRLPHLNQRRRQEDDFTQCARLDHVAGDSYVPITRSPSGCSTMSPPSMWRRHDQTAISKPQSSSGSPDPGPRPTRRTRSGKPEFGGFNAYPPDPLRAPWDGE